MKKITKPLSFVLALMTCLCLTGCGDEPDAPVSTPTSSVTTPSNPAPGSSETENSEPAGSNVTMEPVTVSVTDITLDATAGYGFHHSSTYGNAFSIIYSYGSLNGRDVVNATILIVPLQMTDLDEILATEWCANIKKEELTEQDVGEVKGWMSTADAAKELVAALEGQLYDEIFVELKVGELAANGVSGDEALAQAMNKLAEVGLGDVG